MMPGYRVNTMILLILLNLLIPTEYGVSTVAGAAIVRNEHALRINNKSPTATSTSTTIKPYIVAISRPLPPMIFGTDNATSIIAQSGSTALLPCIVHNLADGVVSWIKHKTTQELLTVGLTTYANDARYQALHFYHGEDWSLQIKYVQGRDAGLYQCQVSTHPPQSIYVSLEVVEARNEIIGPQEKYVRPGSTLQLHCVIKKATVTPSYLFWYHNHRMINYDIEQGIQVNIDLVEHESWLEIQCVSKQHSGNYTCESSNALSARVLVHVIEGDNPAAMQHSTTTCISHRKSIFCVILVLLILSSCLITICIYYVRRRWNNR